MKVSCLNFWEITRVPQKETRELSFFPKQHLLPDQPVPELQEGMNQKATGLSWLTFLGLSKGSHPHHHRTQLKKDKHTLLTEIRFTINLFGALVLWWFLYQSQKLEAWEGGTISCPFGVHSWKTMFIRALPIHYSTVLRDSSSRHSDHYLRLTCRLTVTD